MASSSTLKLFLFLSLLFSLAIDTSSFPLHFSHYRYTCPNVESLVRNAVKQKFQDTFVTAPATLRLFFHDCLVRGCDASVLLSSPSNRAEKDHPDDISLAGDGFDTVIKAKTAVDSDPMCKNKVSCADILALATRDVIALTGGPLYPVELGRLDGKISTKRSVQHRLPEPFHHLNRLNAIFASNGLTEIDLVALSGAHTIGFSHCGKFAKRIHYYSRNQRVDPTLNPSYAKQLQQDCPRDVDPRMAVSMDPTTPTVFDNVYFKNLQQGLGLFTSDQVLYSDYRTRNLVNIFAANNTIFELAFVTAITKLGRVGVITSGHRGEIRRDCSFVN